MYRLYDASPAFLAESAKTGKNAGLQLLPGSGATLYERLAQYPELERIYSAELAHTNEGYRIPLVLEGIRRLQGQVSHVLDIGGNTGVTANAIVNHYPDLRVTVFDLPSVCAKGRAQLTNKSVGFVDGNLGADPVPTGADCVVLSAVLEITPTEQAHALMRRINDALPRGGSVIIVQSATNELETGPLLAASAALYFFNVCSPSPMSICVNDMRLLAADSGFASFEIHRPDDGPMALMIMRK
ncbi:MAG: methyltransferase domain-containing protein [Acidobacteriaceae bacterium]|nr:methyltransferase domain-containing protein [Acidobacteriaceae bacterium]